MSVLGFHNCGLSDEFWMFFFFKWCKILWTAGLLKCAIQTNLIDNKSTYLQWTDKQRLTIKLSITTTILCIPIFNWWQALCTYLTVFSRLLMSYKSLRVGGPLQIQVKFMLVARRLNHFWVNRNRNESSSNLWSRWVMETGWLDGQTDRRTDRRKWRDGKCISVCSGLRTSG